jgi:hypothetical protein
MPPVPCQALTLLLQPFLSSAENGVCVKQLGITTGHTPAAVATLAELCSSLGPGKRLPLASYARVLVVALDITVASEEAINKAGLTEARVGKELERQQTLQQLLWCCVAVMGTFGGMRQMHTSPLGAQIPLPLHDLAAVLCYSWQLLPAGAPARLGRLRLRQLQWQHYLAISCQRFCSCCSMQQGRVMERVSSGSLYCMSWQQLVAWVHYRWVC